MKLAYVLVASLSLGLGGLVACGGSDAPLAQEDSDADELSGRTKTLLEKDNGTTVTVAAGTTLKVKLESNPTTGYDWRVRSVDRTLGYPVITYKASSKAVGGGGFTTLSWATAGALDMTGTHRVELEYQRPWVKDAAPAKTFTFTVKITKQGAPVGRGEGEVCGGFANIPCAEGLKCVISPPPAKAAADFTGICHAPVSCKISGCNREVCAETSRFTACVARPEFACYRKPGVKCEQQDDGRCGWSLTPEAQSCLNPPPPKGCVVSGCNGEICDDVARASACVMRPEFACYRSPGVACEPQANGRCGWSLTAAAKECLAKPPSGG